MGEIDSFSPLEMCLLCQSIFRCTFASHDLFVETRGSTEPEPEILQMKGRQGQFLGKVRMESRAGCVGSRGW